MDGFRRKREGGKNIIIRSKIKEIVFNHIFIKFAKFFNGREKQVLVNMKCSWVSQLILHYV